MTHYLVYLADDEAGANRSFLGNVTVRHRCVAIYALLVIYVCILYHFVMDLMLVQISWHMQLFYVVFVYIWCFCMEIYGNLSRQCALIQVKTHEFLVPADTPLSSYRRDSVPWSAWLGMQSSNRFLTVFARSSLAEQTTPRFVGTPSELTVLDSLIIDLVGCLGIFVDASLKFFSW